MKSISSLRSQSRLFYLLAIASLLIQMGFTSLVQAAAVTASQASIQSATFTTCADVTGIPQSECEVLVALYNSTGGANWTNNTGWLQTSTPCSWFGIECVPDYIYGIELTSNNLTGTIPKELGNLANLEDLELGANNLTGTIPSELGNLANLVVLELSYNQLDQGEIPTWLSNLVKLRSLMLSGTQRTGEIPFWLFDLDRLEILSLDHNLLEGQIPPEITNLTNLIGLNLAGNHLTGSIPLYLGSLSNLQELDFGGNYFSGIIPTELGLLSNLRVMDLAGNQLTGNFPQELGNLVNLQRLDLSSNQLSGQIPHEIGNLVNLTWLALSGNQLTGEIPPWPSNFVNLQILDLRDNQLSGNLPSSIGNLTSLTELYTDSNQLSGEIPYSITSLTGLTILTLSCDLTSTDPLVIAFLDEKLPGWQNRCAQEYNPSIAADVNQDAVALWGWTPGSELSLTIDAAANGGVDYTTSMIMEGSDSAFYVEDAFDIQVGDVIKVTDGTSIRQVTVTYVRILGVNLDTNTVYGEADPFDTIDVFANVNQSCDWQGLVTTDENGKWVADFPGICDFTGVTTIGAEKTDENTGKTRFFLDVPTFTIYPQNNMVNTIKWLVGNEVTLTIDSAANGSIDYTDTKTTDGYHFYTSIDFDLGTFETHPGDLVIITDGITTKKTVIPNLVLGGGDVINDKVWGSAYAGTVIKVSYQGDYSIFRNETADTDGDWMADFSVPGDEPGEEALFDIQPENVMLANQKDEDRDQTQLEWRAHDNHPPVARAGGSYTVYASGTVTLNAFSSYDPDGDALTYEWDLDNDGQYDDARGVITTTSFNQIGDHTIGLRVTDDGGLSDTDTATVTVLPWTLKGFYQPVDMNGVYNVVKNGSTVPLKFEVFADPTELTDIADIKSLTYAQTSCEANATTDEIETTATGGTSLRYDATAGQFVYNWKTPKTAGKCYRVTMTTNDGSSLAAYFKLK